MADVVVVGGGFAGIAAAVRAAKNGHGVTVCEQDDHVGGALRPVEQDGFRWDGGPATMEFPAPVRDLFHKSGRRLDRVLELVPVTSARRHLLGDQVLDLPLNNRGTQNSALADARGQRAATAWTRLLDDYEATWEWLRTHALEEPFAGVRSLRPTDLRTLVPGRSLAAAARRLPDPVLRAALTHHAVVNGSRPRHAPALLGVLAYVERTFGRWTCSGGMSNLLAALEKRLNERRVTVRTEAPVVAVTTARHGVTGVRLAEGEHVPADVVVSAIDSRRLYTDLLDADAVSAGQRQPRLGRPADQPELIHLGLREPPSDVPVETVVHPIRRGDPTLVLRAPRDPALAPAEHAAWTVVCYGSVRDDPIQILANVGIDLRTRMVTRARSTGGGVGFTWRGARGALRRAPNRAPVEGLFCVGATTRPGAGLPFVALGAATVAEWLGTVAQADRPRG